ncbi:hypothetical protein [Geofilum rubicundum]|uniref:hypothetical protein n=1 Tax=Geofilum rubicundum TaxID=472113 RepID=UPI00078281E9|nr:hypothetical protein [Geofilum rubicundum]
MRPNRDSDYTYISSFKQLREELTRLSYEVRLTRKKLDLSLMELSDIFSPVRLLGAVARQWVKPLSASLRQWVENFIKGRSSR